MQLRAKREAPQPQELSIPRRRTLPPVESRREKMLAKLVIELNSDMDISVFQANSGCWSRVIIGCPGLRTLQGSQCIFLNEMCRNSPKSRADNKIEEMELTEEVFQAGDNFVVDVIEKDGAEMLVTKFGQSEIVFGVSGRDIKCAGNKSWALGRLSPCDACLTRKLLFRNNSKGFAI
jgi:hypothetical protein